MIYILQEIIVCKLEYGFLQTIAPSYNQLPKDSGALYPVTNVIDTFVYRGLINMGDVGMSTAAGLYQSMVGLVLILIANYIVRKIEKDHAIF